MYSRPRRSMDGTALTYGVVHASYGDGGGVTGVRDKSSGRIGEEGEEGRRKGNNTENTASTYLRLITLAL